MTGQIALFVLVVAAVGWVAVIVLRHFGRLDRAAIAHQATEALAASRTAAALATPGTLPDAPLVVTSAAAVEPRAAAIACPVCSGRRHVREHVAEEWTGHRLRRVNLRCGSCGHVGDMYVRIVSADPD